MSIRSVFLKEYVNRSWTFPFHELSRWRAFSAAAWNLGYQCSPCVIPSKSRWRGHSGKCPSLRTSCNSFSLLRESLGFPVDSGSSWKGLRGQTSWFWMKCFVLLLETMRTGIFLKREKLARTLQSGSPTVLVFRTLLYQSKVQKLQ